MDRHTPNPACPLTEDQIAHAADRALGLPPTISPVPASPALSRFQTILHTLSQPTLEPAPESLITRLLRLEPQARVGQALDRAGDALTGAVAGALRAIVATLTFDSRVSPALSGFRGTASAIQLAFTSDAGDVHLQIAEPAGPDGQATVRGAFEPADPSSRGAADESPRFILTSPQSGRPCECPIDEDFMFTIRVAPGLYRAALRINRAEIDLGEIQVP